VNALVPDVVSQQHGNSFRDYIKPDVDEQQEGHTWFTWYEARRVYIQGDSGGIVSTDIRHIKGDSGGMVSTDIRHIQGDSGGMVSIYIFVT
jgi:hypothetical protein